VGESDHRQELISIIAVILSSELNKLTSPYCLFALDNLGGFLFPIGKYIFGNFS